MAFLTCFRSAKLFYLELFPSWLQGARGKASMGLGHCLTLLGKLICPDWRGFPLSQHPSSKPSMPGVRSVPVQPLNMRHQPNFFWTIVMCSDPTLSQAGSCSRSWPCHCECKTPETWNCLSGQVLIHLQANNSTWTNGSVLGSTMGFTADPDMCTWSPSPPFFTPSPLV